MAEFAVLAVLWLALVVLVSRRGTAHLAYRRLPVGFGLFGAFAAVLLELLPFTAVSPGITLRTIIACGGGFMAGRLLARMLAAWAASRADPAAARSAAPPRLVHPLIAVGLFVSGALALWQLITLNHSFLEAYFGERDAETGVLKGAEPVSFEGAAQTQDAVLLVHGLCSSPSDFASLPEELRAAGFAVRVPLLPGHGTRPDDLLDADAAAWRRTVREAYDELAKGHARVSVLGFSLGGTLAALEAADRGPTSLVLANPFVGRLASPPWCPVDVNPFVVPAARVLRRVIALESIRGSDPGVTYRTFAMAAVEQTVRLAQELDGRKIPEKTPTFLLLSGADPVTPAPHATQWIASHFAGELDVATWDKAVHRLYREPEGNDAIERTVRFLRGVHGR